MSWGALAPIPPTPSGICNCSGLGSGEVGLEGVPDGYRAMDQRLAKADRSSSEEVRFGRTQRVDEHEGTVARTECAAFQFGLGSVGRAVRSATEKTDGSLGLGRAETGPPSY
jgi:hypothetical protein